MNISHPACADYFLPYIARYIISRNGSSANRQIVHNITRALVIFCGPQILRHYAFRQTELPNIDWSLPFHIDTDRYLDRIIDGICKYVPCDYLYRYWNSTIIRLHTDLIQYSRIVGSNYDSRESLMIRNNGVLMSNVRELILSQIHHLCASRSLEYIDIEHSILKLIARISETRDQSSAQLWA